MTKDQSMQRSKVSISYIFTPLEMANNLQYIYTCLRIHQTLSKK